MAKNSKPANPRSNHHHKKSRDPRSLAPSTTHTEPPQTQMTSFSIQGEIGIREKTKKKNKLKRGRKD
jgi:hypothetical protein